MSAVLKDNDVINAIKGMDGWNYDDVYRCIRKEFDFEVSDVEITLLGKCNKHN